jgi:hypothetical protein
MVAEVRLVSCACTKSENLNAECQISFLQSSNPASSSSSEPSRHWRIKSAVRWQLATGPDITALQMSSILAQLKLQSCKHEPYIEKLRHLNSVRTKYLHLYVGKNLELTTLNQEKNIHSYRVVAQTTKMNPKCRQTLKEITLNQIPLHIQKY